MSRLIDYITGKSLFTKNNVYYLTEPEHHKPREELYIHVRRKEKRIYRGNHLKYLPRVGTQDVHYTEWLIRGKSCDRLIRYLSAKSQSIVLLDLGCGNGWLSGKLSGIQDCTVFAVDLNAYELEFGAQIFAERKHLIFIYWDIFEEILPVDSFDTIILASSVQYFKALHVLLKRCRNLLRNDGEIHIIDSPFYAATSIQEAKLRSNIYYSELGFPEMTEQYHHHLLSDLDAFDPVCLYNPGSFINILLRKLPAMYLSPFHWIKIEKSNERRQRE